MTSALIAMSGGVDSSVATGLAVKRYDHVIGVTLRVSLDPLVPDESAINSAREICDNLGIEHKIVDVSDEFRKKIIKYYVSEYAQGRTPNPCVRCNEEIKFGFLHALRQKMGLDDLVTGHYVGTSKNINGKTLVKRNIDPTKDQSYFLYRVASEVLEHTWFPLAQSTKTNVRLEAKERFDVHEFAAESFDVCFLPDEETRIKLFETYAPQALKEGSIVRRDGKVLGIHYGIANYTYGQRKGLRIGGGTPYFILDMDPQTNMIMVGERSDSISLGTHLTDCVWHTNDVDDLTVQVRYQMKPITCSVEHLPDGCAQVNFDEAVFGIARGQSAVIFKDDLVIGGGYIG